jgi:hypothetical protein
MTNGQRIAEQLKAKAEDRSAGTRLLAQVQRYWPSGTDKYNCEAIRDALMARGIRSVGECGGGHLMEELAFDNKR